MDTLLPDRTPPVSDEARPLILTPSIALHQEGQEHTVEFRVTSIGDLLDEKGKFVGLYLTDGPASPRWAGEVNFSTMQVFVSPALVEEFKAKTGRDLGWCVKDKLVRVRGKIEREKVAFESSDGHIVQHARVRIDMTSLDRIGIVPATTQPGSERAVVAKQEEARTTRTAVAANELLGKPAPLPDAQQWFNGTGPADWQATAGKVVLLDFWGQWCSPCVRKLPCVQELHEKYKDRGLVVLGIHTPDGSANLASFLTEKKTTFPVMIDTGRTMERYGVGSWPTYYLIDKAGKLAWGFNNTPPTDEQVEALLSQ